MSFDLEFPFIAFFDGCNLYLVFCLDSLSQLLFLLSLFGSHLGLWGVGDFDDTCLVLNADISFLGWGGLCEVSGNFSGTCSRSFLAEVVSVVYYHFPVVFNCCVVDKLGVS